MRNSQVSHNQMVFEMEEIIQIPAVKLAKSGRNYYFSVSRSLIESGRVKPGYYYEIIIRPIPNQNSKEAIIDE